MSEKPYYKHCGNCKWCGASLQHKYVCEIKHTRSDTGRLRAIFCKFFKEIREK